MPTVALAADMAWAISKPPKTEPRPSCMASALRLVSI